MNDLLSSKFSREGFDDVELAEMNPGENLNGFFEQVNEIQNEMDQIQKLLERIRSANEESKTVHKASAMKDLRKRMEKEVETVLKKGKFVKAKLEALDKENAASQRIPGCGPGSSTDRTRMATTNGLRNSLKKLMNEFQILRETMKTEYRETIERRYYTVTGETADEETIEKIIESGESENILQKAIQEQGRGRILDVISEIQERHDAVRDIEKNLMELHQVFLDMAVLVQTQGEQLDDIEAQVGKASSFVQRGTGKLAAARKLQKNTRKWTCIAIIILLILILVIVLPLVLKK